MKQNSCVKCGESYSISDRKGNLKVASRMSKSEGACLYTAGDKLNVKH